MRPVQRFASLGFALLLATGSPCGSASDPAWHLATTAHFNIVTDGSELDARTRGMCLELLREVLQTVSPDLRRIRLKGDRDPSFVYLFSRERQFREWASGSGLEGWFVPRADGYYMAVNAESAASYQTAAHEYIHQFLAANCPAIPLWLNEGMATFFQTIEIEGQVVRIGAPPKYYDRDLLDRGVMPVSRLLAMDRGSKTYRDEYSRQWFYTSSWFFTAYLMTGGDDLRAQLGVYFDLLQTKASPDEAFRKAFARRPEDLDNELKAYLKKAKSQRAMPIWTIHFRNLGYNPAFRYVDLPPAEAKGRLGLLGLSGSPEIRKRSHACFQEALVLDPRCSPALLGMSLLSMEAKNRGEALHRFQEACAGDPPNGMAHHLAAMVQIEQDGGRILPERLPEIREHLVRAIELHCVMKPALPILKAIASASTPPSTADLSALERASRAIPDDSSLKLDLARLLLQAERQEEAKPLLESLAAQTWDQATAEEAGRLLKAGAGTASE